MRLVDGRWHCGGCGWRADCEAGSLHGAPRQPSLSRPLDEGSGQAEASRLESRLAGGFGGQMGLDLPNLLLGSNLHGSPGFSAVTGLFKSLNMTDLLQSLSAPGLGIGSDSSRVSALRNRNPQFLLIVLIVAVKNYETSRSSQLKISAALKVLSTILGQRQSLL